MTMQRALEMTGRVLDAWLPLKIGYAQVPGMSVGITYRGKLVYAAGFGFADVENAVPATPSTAYRIASNSKTFTAVSVMQLVEAGKLALDDRIATHLSWFKAKVRKRDAANVTIRQALAHTGGVFRDGVTPHWTDDRFPTAAQLRSSVSTKTVVYENSTRFKYSNFGFALVGAVIAKVSGISYVDYVTRNIIEPLGMTRTAPDLTPESRAWLAAGYSRPIPNHARERFEHCETNAYAPATGFLSTVEDLAKYLSALSLVRNTSKLIGRESKKELFRQHWTSPMDGSYGLGFSVWQLDGKRVVGHGGGFPGFITRIALNLDDDIGAVVLANANESPSGFVADGILEAIFRFATGDHFSGRAIAGLQRFEGAYRSRWADQVVVSTGTRLVAFPPQTNSPLKEGTVLRPVATSSFVIDSPFSYDSPGERARFLGRTPDGSAKRLIWGSQPMDRITQVG